MAIETHQVGDTVTVRAEIRDPANNNALISPATVELRVIDPTGVVTGPTAMTAQSTGVFEAAIVVPSDNDVSGTWSVAVNTTSPRGAQFGEFQAQRDPTR